MSAEYSSKPIGDPPTVIAFPLQAAKHGSEPREPGAGAPTETWQPKITPQPADSRSPTPPRFYDKGLVTPPPVAHAETPAPRTRTYEELDGAAGRAVFYRPERYKADDLSTVRPVVTLAMAGGPTTECQLHDLSQNGVAFVPPAGVAFRPGLSIQTLTVSIDGYEAYRGEARVVSVRTVDDAAVVAATFVDSLMNIDDVLHLRAVKAWKPQSDPGVAIEGRTWHVAGHERFKALVGEMRLFLEDAYAHYGQMEASLPWHVVQGDTDSPARSALIDRVAKEFVADFIPLTEALDTAVRQASEQDWHRLKEFSIRHLHDFFMQAPLLQRSRVKPLGYPGDYEAMVYMYSRPFEGQTLFAKALHLGACASMPAQAVRARKNLLRDRIRGLATGWQEERPLRICSIAAGPSQEVFEFLNQTDEIGGPLEIVLFEQDKLALTFAQRRLGPLVESKWKGRVRLILLQDSIKRLLFDPHLFGKLGPFDMVFAAGLFDYLRVPTAVNLTRNLFANLGPGGTCLIGNMDPSNPGRWMFEHHLDWFLNYRTAAEMLEFGRTALPGVEMEIVEDLTHINPFLVVHKD